MGSEAETETEKDEVPPLTEAEFAEFKAKNQVLEAIEKENTDAPIVYGAAPRFVADHSMELYLEKVRALIGVVNPN